jgi:hypothetical protein
MKGIIKSEYVLPAYWASALLNGDSSGMSEAECDDMDAWYRHETPGWCVDVSDEEEFAMSNDATTIGGAVATFTFHKEGEEFP